MSLRILYILIFVWTFQLSHQQERTFVGVKCNATLSRENVNAVYDGDDSIYILDGYIGAPNYYTTTVLRYSISSDSTQSVATMPVRRLYGGAAIDSRGKLYYFGGQSSTHTLYTSIYQIDPAIGNVTLVGNLPGALNPEAPVQHTSDGVIYFSAYVNDLEFKNYTTERHSNPGIPLYRNAVWDNETSNILVLTNKELAKYHLPTRTLSKSWMNYTVSTYPKTIWADSSLYVLKGWSTGTYPSNGILRFNIETGQPIFYQVEPYPPMLASVTPVYVGKLRRIYLFGGRDIWYIQMDDTKSSD